MKHTRTPPKPDEPILAERRVTIERHPVRATVEDEEVDEQHCEHPDDEESPNPERNVHEIPRSNGRRSLRPPVGAWRSGPRPG